MRFVSWACVCLEHEDHEEARQERCDPRSDLRELLLDEELPHEVHDEDDPHDGKREAVHLVTPIPQVLDDEAHPAVPVRSGM